MAKRRRSLDELIRETQRAGRELDAADEAARRDPSPRTRARLRQAIAAHDEAYRQMHEQAARNDGNR